MTVVSAMETPESPTQKQLNNLQKQIQTQIVGQDKLVNRLLITLLAASTLIGVEVKR